MRLLLITFYYPPDLCAGSFRAQALVQALQKTARANTRVDVMTTMPNRYHSWNIAAAAREDMGNISIRRIPLAMHRSGMVDQSKAFVSFARSVLRETRGGNWDIVVATSSRLMTAALGARVAGRVGAPLYLDIRDMFADTFSDLKTGMSKVLLPALRLLETWTLRSAARVNLVSAGFLPDARRIAPQHDYRFFTNGIDEDFLSRDFTARNGETNDLPLIVYAGNIGQGQGLHRIVPEAARILDGRVRFRLIGDGGQRVQLEEALSRSGARNVELVDPIPRSELFRHYREADILFLHLNDQTALQKVLPSKLFEYAATGKPILAGVAGYAADFLEREVPGAAVFPPCDVNGLIQALDHLIRQPKIVERDVFKQKYERERIMHEMAGDIIALGIGD